MHNKEEENGYNGFKKDSMTNGIDIPKICKNNSNVDKKYRN